MGSKHWVRDRQHPGCEERRDVVQNGIGTGWNGLYFNFNTGFLCVLIQFYIGKHQVVVVKIYESVVEEGFEPLPESDRWIWVLACFNMFAPTHKWTLYMMGSQEMTSTSQPLITYQGCQPLFHFDVHPSEIHSRRCGLLLAVPGSRVHLRNVWKWATSKLVDPMISHVFLLKWTCRYSILPKF